VATAKLELAHRDGMLTLTVIDSGRGLPQGHQPGPGIRGMSERAALIGATLAIENAGTRGGVRVRLEVALDEVEELEQFQSLNGAVQPHELGETR
jgi:signal transduction histidine kinase